MLAGTAPDVPATAVSPAALLPSTAMSLPLSEADEVEAWAGAGRGGSAKLPLEGAKDVLPGRERPLALLGPALPFGADEVEGRASEDPGANDPNELKEDMMGRGGTMEEQTNTSRRAPALSVCLSRRIRRLFPLQLTVCPPR